MKTKNYKLFFLFVGAMLFIVNSTIAQKTTYDDSWAKAGFNLYKENSTGVKITYSINEFTLGDIEIKGEAMQKLMLPGHFLPNDEGAPDLPGNGRYIAIPQSANAKLIISASRVETLSNINISPAPRIPLDTETGPLVYNKNEKIYSTNAFYPEKPVILSTPSKIRGVDVVMLGITPFQYNPVTKELLVYRDLEIEIVFEGGNNHFGEDVLRSRWFDPILKDAILNNASLPEIDYNKRTLNYNSSRDVGCEYLIVSPDGAVYQQWADSIKSFRLKQGIITDVVTLTDIGGNTASILENYFNNAYNNWDIRPVAVLLLGDFGSNMDNNIMSPIYNSYCASDNIYADVDGDHMPEMTFARITSNNADQVETMVSKFINHERNPPTNPDFYDNPITALGWQTSRWFQICSESIGGFFKNEHGKDPVRINAIYSGNPSVDPWSTASNTSTVVNYFGPNGLGYIPASPSTLGGWSGGNATMINNAINSGAFLLQHRDHGNVTLWGEPSYNNGNINSLYNADLVFVLSINCLTGKYNASQECFAEKFHRHTSSGQNAGALGIIAASETSYSFVNDTYVWGVYDNMWTDFMPDYGTTPDSRGLLPAFGNSAGKYFLQQSSWPSNPGQKVITYNLFHHHGGAFLTLYSEVPQDLSILHDGLILGGLDFFTVQATDGAFIALTVNDEIIGTGTGAGIGIPIDISIIPQQAGSVVLMTATLTNYYRYTELIDVIPPDGPYCIQDSYTIDDDNGNGIPEYGETILISLAIKNLGNSDAIGANVKISANDSYIIISDSAEYYDTIHSQQIVTVTDGFEIQVADNIPDQHMTMFDVTVTDELDSTWNSVIFMIYSAPLIEIGDMTINDMLSGNGNGRLDPGETAEIIVKNYNNGHCFAENSIGYLTTDCQYIELLNEVDTIGTIGFFGPGVARFDVIVDPEAPNGVIVAIFDYEVVSGAYQETETFSQKIGLLFEDFETGDFTKFDWQHDGDLPWFVSNLYPYEGYYSAKSGAIGDNQYSELFLIMETMAADSISFIRKVSSESGDKLKFFINGSLMDEWSGTSHGWVKEIYPVGIGTFTFEWVYEKNGGATAGADCAWLDYIIMPPEMTLTCYAGPDDYVCEGDDFQCMGEATDWVSVEWTTSGTGTFSDPTILQPIYTPSIDDITAGMVILTLTVTDSDGDVVDDDMDLTFKTEPEAPEIPTGPDYVDLVYTTISEYTVESTPLATSYEWNIEPVEAGTISGNDLIGTVEWDLSYLGYAYISVKAINECGESDYSDAFEVTVDNTVVINENINDLNIRVYPNPSTGNFTINLNSDKTARLNIKIINPIGSLIYKESNIQVKGSYTNTLDLSNLPVGIYYLIIEGDNINSINKIMIQK